MGALLDELAMMEDADAVRLLDGGEAMGDDETGAVGAEVFKGLLDETLGGVIKRGSGFV